MKRPHSFEYRYDRLGCVVDRSSSMALEAFEEIARLHPGIERIDLPRGTVVPGSEQTEYDVIITIGGDGAMLRTIHSFIHCNIPIYGINRGSLGFLLNNYDPHHLLQNINSSISAEIHPIEMEALTASGDVRRSLAINEVALLRSSHQSAKISIGINGKERLDRLVGDGILLATAAGSSAYNFAAHGPLVPLESKLLLLTPIAPFRPRRWQGAIVSNTSQIQFTVQEPHKRPVNASADFIEVKRVLEVRASLRHDITVTLLFDHHHSLEERILNEQFAM